MDFGFLAKRAEKLVADNSPAILSAVGATGVAITAFLVGKATFRAAKILSDEEAANRKFQEDTPITNVELVEEEGKLTGKAKDAAEIRELQESGMSVGEIAELTERPEATVEALLKFNESVRKAISEPYVPLDNRAKFKLIWKEYVPAAVIGAITVTSIFGANRIGTRRAVAMATAFRLSQKAADEYQDKVLAKFGKNKEGQVRDELAQDRANKHPISTDQEMYLLNLPGIELWMDGFSGRFFRSDRETVRSYVNDFNEMLHRAGSASLSDFWELLGLEPTDVSNDLGWTAEKILVAEYTAVSTRLGPAMVIGYKVQPVRQYYKYG